MSIYNSNSFLYNSTTSFGGSPTRKPNNDLFRSYSNLNTAPSRSYTSDLYDSRNSGSFASFRHGSSSNDDNNSSSGCSSRAISIQRVNTDYDSNNNNNNHHHNGSNNNKNKKHVTYFDNRSNSIERPCYCNSNSSRSPSRYYERSASNDRSYRSDSNDRYGDYSSRSRIGLRHDGDEKTGSSYSINGNNKDSDYETVTEIYSSTEVIDQIGSNKASYQSMPIRGDFEAKLSTKVLSGNPSVITIKPQISSASASNLRSLSSSSSIPLTSTRNPVVSNFDSHRNGSTSSSSSYSSSSRYEPVHPPPFKSAVRPMPNVSTLVAPLPPKQPWPIIHPVIYPPTDAYTGGRSRSVSRTDLSRSRENLKQPDSPKHKTFTEVTTITTHSGTSDNSNNNRNRSHQHEHQHDHQHDHRHQHCSRHRSATPESRVVPANNHQHHHNHQNQLQEKHQPQHRNQNDSSSNDLAASAVSNIKLNVTDDLTTQVDYLLNEVCFKFYYSNK